MSGASSKVKACSFDNDTCDWHNVPFDDDTDFVVRSSSSGGPSSGAGGSGKLGTNVILLFIRNISPILIGQKYTHNSP